MQYVIIHGTIRLADTAFKPDLLTSLSHGNALWNVSLLEELRINPSGVGARSKVAGINQYVSRNARLSATRPRMNVTLKKVYAANA